MSQKKTERLLNLLVALLHTELGVSRDRLLRDVYGWSPGSGREREAVERQFERDKADLRALGADISERQGYEREDSSTTTSLYRIDPRLFRLPEIEFTPQEQSLLALAGIASQGALAGSPARAALRRLEAAGALPDSPPSLVQPRVRLEDPRYVTLADAASRRAEVSFDYYAASTDREESRLVQPWGLGQRYGQWYLVGLDVDRQAPRVYRLSRIRGRIDVQGEQVFEPPVQGAVHEQLERLETLPTQTARLRVAEGRALEFRTVWTPLRGGAPDGWELGEYSFRDVTVAADYLAGFGDALVVESPTPLAHAVVRRLDGALTALGSPGAAPVEPSGATRRERRSRPSDERLGRIVDLVPYLLQGPVQLEEAAERYGMSPRELERELSVLEYTGPTDLGGWQDYIEIGVHDGVVSLANAPELARPRRLSIEEALSLQLGLQALVPLASEDEQPALEALAAKVGAATFQGARTVPQIDLNAEPQRNAELVPILRAAVAEHATLRLEYLNPTKDERSERLVNPLALRSDGDRWYVEAYCHRAGERRVFRVDRIVSLESAASRGLPEGVDDEPGELLIQPSETDVDAVLRLAPEALWVEHEYAAEGGVDLEDGSRRVHLRVAGLRWLPRFLAQFGGSVALEGPDVAIEACRSWLTRARDAASSG